MSTDEVKAEIRKEISKRVRYQNLLDYARFVSNRADEVYFCEVKIREINDKLKQLYSEVRP